jgi:uncharacterized protein (DUF302 family)
MEPAISIDGLTTILCSAGPRKTMDRLVAEVQARGMTAFARIDHAAGAAAAGLVLRPTELLIFGHAKAGTPLMQAAQTIGIDLPLRVVVWQDERQQTWLSYNEPRWLADRHSLGPEVQPVLDAMTAALEAVTSAAAGEVSAATS